jgi:hypothetical protein
MTARMAPVMRILLDKIRNAKEPVALLPISLARIKLACMRSRRRRRNRVRIWLNVALEIPLLDKPREEDHLSVNNLVGWPDPHLGGKVFNKKKRKRRKINQSKSRQAARLSLN